MNRSRFNESGAGATRVRPSPIAGQWYPGVADRLREQVRGYLAAAEVPSIDGRIVALVAPHAGYTYSGGVAAHAYRLVAGRQYDVVVIVGPNHRILDPAPYLVADYSAYWTPLGQVPLAIDLLADLDDRLGFNRVRRDEEHSLEIQLPFLQVALDGAFRLVPVMLGDRSAEACYALGEALADVLQGRNALLVASTDLSHFYSGETAARLDGAVTARIADFDPQGLLEVLATGKGEACGGAPTVATMLAARALGADRARLLKYATSGDATGDYVQVVGYAAAVLYAAGA
jgi:AmmeMemoRadiSam system protein B